MRELTQRLVVHYWLQAVVSCLCELEVIGRRLFANKGTRQRSVAKPLIPLPAVTKIRRCVQVDFALVYSGLNCRTGDLFLRARLISISFLCCPREVVGNLSL